VKKQIATILVVILTTGLTHAQEKRTFMFIGEPNTAAWKYLVDNPQDRREAVTAATEKIGGKIISYYFGLGDGKNYITMELPNDNVLIQALYLMRLPSGLLNSYQMIELMSSSEMSNALKKSKELIELEKKITGGVPEGK